MPTSSNPTNQISQQDQERLKNGPLKNLKPQYQLPNCCYKKQGGKLDPLALSASLAESCDENLMDFLTKTQKNITIFQELFVQIL